MYGTTVEHVRKTKTFLQQKNIAVGHIQDGFSDFNQTTFGAKYDREKINILLVGR
jgi:hypothetical protein